jgi:hypothetical protein
MKNQTILSLLCLTVLAGGQEPPPHGGGKPAEHASGGGKAGAAHEGPEAFEAEYVFSDVFRSGSYIQPLWKALSFEGHYFGGKAADTGFTGGSWTFRLGELKLSPGFGVLFGSKGFATTPSVSFRWDYERGWFVSQGLIVQGFRDSPVFREEEEGGHESHGESTPVGYVRPTISDGNHVSARWKRLTVGGSWEHIQFREGDEWKGGPRVGVRILPRLSAVLYLLYPGRAEWRAGVLVHPKHEH